MNKPKTYRIVDIDKNAQPLNSAIIINHIAEVKSKCCKCGSDSSTAVKYLIQGYDDFTEVDLSKPAFLGFDVLPLFATLENAKKVTNALSGCKLAKVGYDDWNQYEIPKSEAFTREPILGAVEVTGSCNGLFCKSTQKPLKASCDKCYNMYAVDENEDIPLADVLLDYAKWDGSDIFQISYAYKIETIITEEGRKKLENLGFENIIYEEIRWG